MAVRKILCRRINSTARQRRVRNNSAAALSTRRMTAQLSRPGMGRIESFETRDELPPIVLVHNQAARSLAQCARLVTIAHQFGDSAGECFGLVGDQDLDPI